MATASNDGEEIEEEMPEYLRIPPSDIQIGEQIGQGGFSTVHKASWRGKTCAAKVVQTANVLAIQKEVAILSKLEHPNVIGCIGFSVDSSSDQGRCMILMELMDGGDLRHVMNERLKSKARKGRNVMPFSETEAVDILGNIVKGMEYLHSRGVFHGDLKASNVLVTQGRYCKLVVKITDFGVSQMVKLEPDEDFNTKKHFRGAVGTRGYQAPEVSSSSVAIPACRVSSQDIFSNAVGTRNYLGPEYFGISPQRSYPRYDEKFYSAKADTYCFAMTCYEVFSGRVPFESVRKADIAALVLQGTRPKLPRGLDRRLKALVKQCWHQKPTKRPSFEEIRSSLIDYYSRDPAPQCWGWLLRRSPRG